MLQLLSPPEFKEEREDSLKDGILKREPKPLATFSEMIMYDILSSPYQITCFLNQHIWFCNVTFLFL
jgi:hypothetical protein